MKLLGCPLIYCLFLRLLSVYWKIYNVRVYADVNLLKFDILTFPCSFGQDCSTNIQQNLRFSFVCFFSNASSVTLLEMSVTTFSVQIILRKKIGNVVLLLFVPFVLFFNSFWFLFSILFFIYTSGRQVLVIYRKRRHVR